MEANPRNHGKPFEVEKKPASQDYTSTTPGGALNRLASKWTQGRKKMSSTKAYPHLDRLTI